MNNLAYKDYEDNLIAFRNDKAKRSGGSKPAKPGYHWVNSSKHPNGGFYRRNRKGRGGGKGVAGKVAAGLVVAGALSGAGAYGNSLRKRLKAKKAEELQKRTEKRKKMAEETEARKLRNVPGKGTSRNKSVQRNQEGRRARQRTNRRR